MGGVTSFRGSGDVADSSWGTGDRAGSSCWVRGVLTSSVGFGGYAETSCSVPHDSVSFRGFNGSARGCWIGECLVFSGGMMIWNLLLE